MGVIKPYPALRPRVQLVGCCLLLALAPLGCAGGSAPATGAPGAQLEFGVQMARRGLWNEALFRFEQAQRSNPNNPRLLNNLAVAYEAVGRYDEALATYQKAVRMAPGESRIRENLSRFSQFYESFRPDEEGGEAAPAEAEETPSDAGTAGEETPESEPQKAPADPGEAEPTSEPTPEPTPEQAPEPTPERAPEPSPEPPPRQAPEPPSESTPEETG